jgi:hypothetical protein
MKMGTISRALAVQAVRLTTWKPIQSEMVQRIRKLRKERVQETIQVRITQSVTRLQGVCLGSQGSLHEKDRDLSFPHRVQTALVSQSPSYPMGSEALSPLVKGLGSEVGHPPTSSAKVRMHGVIFLFLHLSSWRGA